MKEKEAREAIAFQESDSLKKNLDTMALALHAQGYLECFEQAKPLVEFVEKCSNLVMPSMEKEGLLNWIFINSKRALARWDGGQK